MTFPYVQAVEVRWEHEVASPTVGMPRRRLIAALTARFTRPQLGPFSVLKFVR